VKATWQIAIGVAAITIAAITIGHDGRRVAQVAVLALPGIAVLLLPAVSTRMRIARAAFVWVWSAAFAADAITRGYFDWAHQAAPDSSLVQSAMAGTSERETQEFLHMYKGALTLWAGVLAGILVALALLLKRTLRASADSNAPLALSTRTGGTVVILATLLCAGGYLTPAWRNLHPALYWSEWVNDVRDLRTRWSDLADERKALLMQAKAVKPALGDTQPSTVVLIVADSINRDNMSLYGYPRKTTPRLEQLISSLGNNAVVLKNGWSSDSSTVPALRKLFQFGIEEPGAGHHLVALARAAGYSVWWLSNQDDVTIDQEHAQLADHVHMFNRMPGRNSTTLDEVVLPQFEAALAAPQKRKFIVVHLMGAHPHYTKRFPAGANPFDDTHDSVDRQIAEMGRSPWTAYFREEYDAAILYHDDVVTRIMEMTARLPDDGYQSVLYLSDHGQEVGHEVDRAGHSRTTAAGYRIPAIIWESTARTAPVMDLHSRGFRSDWAAWTIVHLLGIDWPGRDESRDVLDPGYRWQEPMLPATITSYTK
jgi:heptose-I-phosphate ethanolaminephosphotransferase